MKRLLASIALLLVITCYLWSCEKDDICADGTPTTPSLIIEFYDKDNQTELKSITNLKYYVLGMPIVGKFTGTKLALPLKVDANTVKWAFKYTQNLTGGGTVTNIDYIKFNYTRDELYVSRACGYKTIFKLDTDSNDHPNPELTDSTANDGFWIDDITVQTLNILDENETHIKIYF
jgi:hypothetical protein